jgi:MFS family permease
MNESGVTDSLIVLGLMRVFHGMLNTSTNPLSFSLMSDYFPPEKRTFANSMIQAGNHIGYGISSLLIVLITQYGWRESYEITGAFGLVFGISALAFIREPVRGKFAIE